jgi:hypothetical protein
LRLCVVLFTTNAATSLSWESLEAKKWRKIGPQVLRENRAKTLPLPLPLNMTDSNRKRKSSVLDGMSFSVAGFLFVKLDCVFLQVLMRQKGSFITTPRQVM